MSGLSIGLFTYATKPRGSVVHAAALAEALAERGHDVTLYALDKDGEGFYRPVRCALALVPAGSAPPGSDLLIAQRIAELSGFVTARRPRHDVVHAEDCLVASGLLAARARLGGSLLCRTVHHVERFESPYLEACQERSVREVDLCVTVSRATRKEVLRTYGRGTEVVANGVDASRFAQPCAREAAALRERLGIARGARVLLSIGGVEPRKNTLGMLDAFLVARRTLPGLRWVIAGGATLFEHAAYRATFDARLGALAPDARAAILALGVLPEGELTCLVQTADALMHASTHEGFGLCVLEAMAAETPVVVSRGAPFDEYLDDGCALRVDPDNTLEMAAAIVRALRDGPTRRARIEAGLARAAEYGWERCAARHEALYLAARRRR